jgi:type IV secretion system protein VirB8
MKFQSELNDTGQEYYLLWWQARVATIGFVVLLALVVILISFMIWLFPLKEIMPVLVTFHNGQIAKVASVEVNTPAIQNVAEGLARQYVVEAETFDGQTEDYRIKRLILLSSPELESYLKTIDPNDSGSVNKQFKERGITRAVNIKNSLNLGPMAPNVWQVEWESLDVDVKTREETRANWISTLTVDIREKRMSIDDRFVNPIGFTVIHYQVGKREIS